MFNVNRFSRMPGYAFKSQGLSLVEMMVAITIGLLLLLGLANLLISTSHNFKTQDDFSRIQENGAFALNTIGYDIRHAGFYGFLGVRNVTVPVAITAPTNDCGGSVLGTSGISTTSDPNVFYTSTVGMSGISSSNAHTNFPCIDAANFQTGSPVLLLRGAAGSPVDTTTTAFAADNNLYVQGDPTTAIVFQGSAYSGLTGKRAVLAAGSTGTIVNAEVYPFFYHLYYIRPCSQAPCTGSSDGGHPIPTLVRQSLVANAAGNLEMQEESVIEGVEDMTILYGVDNTAPGAVAGSVITDGIVDRYTSTPNLATEMPFVISMTVTVRVRSPKPDFTYDDSAKSYDNGLGTAYTSTGDARRYHRHVFRQTFQVRNIYVRQAS